MKTYARQIPPEYQESPLSFGPEFWPDDLIVTGNRDFTGRTTPEYDQIARYFDEMADCWHDANYFYSWDDYAHRLRPTRRARPELNGEPYSLRELLHDYGFESPTGKPWSTQQRHEWKLILEHYERLSDDRNLLKALELMTGESWDKTTIRGCCQGDWQEVIYPMAKWTSDDLERFEAEYFNTGTEWMIHDEDSEPEDADDVSGYCVYCYGWNTDKIRAEIAQATGCEPEDVVLYEFTGYTQHAKYQIA